VLLESVGDALFAEARSVLYIAAVLVRDMLGRVERYLLPSMRWISDSLEKNLGWYNEVALPKCVRCIY